MDDSASFVNTSFVNSVTLTYSWDFGDGNMSIEESPKHIYENPGTYSVELVATSDLGSVASYDALVTIHPLPSATMVMDNVCNGTSTQFTNLSSISGGSMTYSWDFGDSNTSTEYQPSHLYDVYPFQIRNPNLDRLPKHPFVTAFQLSPEYLPPLEGEWPVN